MTKLKDLAQRLALRFRRGERGTASIEFVLVFPPIFILFVSAYEAGLAQIRSSMLERGLDTAVRDVRLATSSPPSYDELKEMVCAGAMLIPDCLSSLKLEMRRLDPRGTISVPRDADCIDREEEVDPVRSFVAGDENELMFIRACALFKPMFPQTGLGFQLHKDGNGEGEYSLVSMSAFVTEPK